MKAILFFILLYQSTVAQVATESALIVAEYGRDRSAGSWTYLVSYNFNKGHLLSKDTLWSGRSNTPYVDFNFGQFFIYNNRYIISSIGGLFDLKTNQPFKKDMHTFIGAKDHQLFFYNSYDGYFIWNSKNNSYRKISEKTYKAARPIIASKTIVSNCKWQGTNFLFGAETDTVGRYIFYKEKSIGKVWCYPFHSFHNDHYLATEWGKTGKPLGFQSTQGFKLWNSFTKEWNNYPISSLCNLIGWVEK